ncbi:MAG: hypothetical protein V1866_04155 [archaeon]
MGDKVALMSKVRLVSIFLIIFLLAATNALAVSVVLKSPSNNSKISTSRQDFIFSFDNYQDILNCTLFIDSQPKRVMNSLIKVQDNKIATELEDGEHAWFIRCYDSSSLEINSESRALTVGLTMITKEGYETLYNNNGFRSYLITLFQGQKPITLPPMKGGEDIRLKINSDIHYIDVLKMGATTNSSFVEIRDRSNEKKYRLLLTESVNLDLDNDKKIDATIKIVDIKRGVDAYFIVTPYPEGQAQITTPETSEPATETNVSSDQTTTITPDQGQANEEETDSQEPQQTEQPAEQSSEDLENSTPAIIIAIIVAAIIIAAVVIFSSRKKCKKPGKKEGRKTQEHKPAPDQEHETNALESKKDEEEKFDIIKSAGKRKR